MQAWLVFSKRGKDTGTHGAFTGPIPTWEATPHPAERGCAWLGVHSLPGESAGVEPHQIFLTNALPVLKSLEVGEIF